MPFSVDRMNAICIRDALINPHQTIDPHVDPLVYKDPGYVDLKKRGTKAENMRTRTIQDNMGRNILKLEEEHGNLNGGLVCQTTHGRDNSPVVKQGTFKYKNSLSHAAQQIMQTSPREEPRAHLAQQKRFSQADLNDHQTQKALNKKILHKKLTIMQTMLDNERNANNMISTNLKSLHSEMHANHSDLDRFKSQTSLN